MNGESNHMAHLTEEQLVAFLGRELEGEDRFAVEQHLATCAECRDELVAVTEILKPERVRPSIPWRVLAPVAAAAAAVLLVVGGPLREQLLEDDPRHRDSPAELVPSPTPVAPLGEVEGVSYLVWRAVPGADRYRVSVFDRSGEVVWRATTPDTVTQLPDSVSLSPGATYLWRLEARLGWDLWEASGLVEFTIVSVDASPSP
jgi:hypothetical protein